MVYLIRVIHGSVEAHRQVSPRLSFWVEGVSRLSVFPTRICSGHRVWTRLQWGASGLGLERRVKGSGALRREEGDQLSSKLLSLAPTEV